MGWLFVKSNMCVDDSDAKKQLRLRLDQKIPCHNRRIDAEVVWPGVDSIE